MGKWGTPDGARSAILKRLGAQRPVPHRRLRMQIALRWVVVVCLAALFPFAAIVTASNSPLLFRIPAAVLGLFSAIGLIAIALAWVARRQSGVDAQWGLAPLTSDQIHEFVYLAESVPEINAVVSDEWLVRWASTSSDLRGQDLVLLRRSVAQFKALPLTARARRG